MVNALLLIILSTLIVSLIAFLGILTLYLKEKLLSKILLSLVSLSAGALLGDAFLHLIPEAVETVSSEEVFLYVLIGFILFFFIEKVLHWHHCHKGYCKEHSFAYMILIGDAVHNLIDGLIIAASFLASPIIGFTTTLAIILHEIPQELGDFGVLVHGGFKKSRALFLNFLTALTALLGGIIGYFISSESVIGFFLPFAAGGFIYIAASDLIPELKKEVDFKKYILHFIIFLAGILAMYGLVFLE